MEKRGWGLLVVFFISCFVTIFFIANILGAPLDNCLNNVSSCTFCSWSMAKCSGGSCPTTGHPITQITNAQIYNYHSEMFRVFNLPPDTCNFQQSSCGSGNLECSAPGINICKNASWSSESTININNASDPMLLIVLLEI